MTHCCHDNASKFTCGKLSELATTIPAKAMSVSQHLQLTMAGFCLSKVVLHAFHALADGKYRI